jgi:Xaa-Pro aminopeptidase
MSHLSRLRSLMHDHGLGGYIIPRTDEFQSEYVASYAERLKFLTGFTGSAGLAIITQSKGAFFTDGRYILQAQGQLDPSEFEIFNTADMNPWTWAAAQPDLVLGYDPWLFTPSQLRRYESVTCKAIETNLVDQVWGEQQPARPSEKIFIHPLEFAGEAFEEKCDRIAAGLNDTNHLLLSSPDSIAWLLNIRGRDVEHTPVALCYAVLHTDGSFDLFIDLNKIDATVNAHLLTKGHVQNISNIETYLKSGALAGSIQYDPRTTPQALVNDLKSTPLKLNEDTDLCQLPKALKNTTEQSGARQAHIRDGVALCKFLAWLQTQPLKGETTEISASDRLEAFRREGQYFHDLSFDTISGFGPHGAIIHYRADAESDASLTRNGLYLLDSGAQYLDGTTDVTRTIACGTPTPEQRDRFTRVLKGHIALASLTFPKGVTGAHIDVLARAPLWEQGLDYDHGTGHGVGSFLAVHEGPQGISRASQNVPLQPGMLVSNEPGFYKDGAYGIRIESVVLVTERPDLSITKPFYGFETLTLAPIDLALVDETLLTKAEIQWLNAYHVRVFETISPHLDSDEQTWLKTATRCL